MNTSLAVKRFATTLSAFLLLSSASIASAQTNTTSYVPKEEIKQNEAEAALRTGRIDGKLALTASFSLASNQNVVGQVDGFSTLVGIGLVGGLDYLKGDYEMRNTLRLNESFARTPVLDEFIKTNDVIEIENLHNYFFLKWAGAFGRFSLNSNLLPTEDVRVNATSYILTNPNAGQEEVLATDTQRFQLNGSFAPISISQSFGLFAEPVRSEPVALTIRTGLGARQTLADGVFVIADDVATADRVEVKQLTDVIQAGTEVFVGARGAFKENRMTYEVGAAVMIPFLNNDAQDRRAVELTRIAAEGNLTFSVFEWLNLVYSLRAINDPQLIDDWQLQNNLLLTFQYTFIDRSQAKPTDPSEVDKAKALAAEAENKAQEAEKKAQEAEQRALEAEQKAAEAEQKAREAEQKLQAQPPVEPPTPDAPGTPESP